MVYEGIHATSKVYQFVPIEDFTINSKIDWNRTVPDIDMLLYKKYDLTPEEIGFINSTVGTTVEVD